MVISSLAVIVLVPVFFTVTFVEVLPPDSASREELKEVIFIFWLVDTAPMHIWSMISPPGQDMATHFLEALQVWVAVQEASEVQLVTDVPPSPSSSVVV